MKFFIVCALLAATSVQGCLDANLRTAGTCVQGCLDANLRGLDANLRGLDANLRDRGFLRTNGQRYDSVVGETLGGSWWDLIPRLSEDQGYISTQRQRYEPTVDETLGLWPFIFKTEDQGYISTLDAPRSVGGGPLDIPLWERARWYSGDQGYISTLDAPRSVGGETLGAPRIPPRLFTEDQGYISTQRQRNEPTLTAGTLGFPPLRRRSFS